MVTAGFISEHYSAVVVEFLKHADSRRVIAGDGKGFHRLKEFDPNAIRSRTGALKTFYERGTASEDRRS